MSIWNTTIPIGPDAKQHIQRLLADLLRSGGPSLGDIVCEAAGRLYVDLNRLPWTAAVLGWLGQADRHEVLAFIAALEAATTDARHEVACEAALLLLAVADQGVGHPPHQGTSAA